MTRPISRDQRYTVALEYCGHPEPRHVARFCGDWIGQGLSYSAAVLLCVGHDNVRRGAAVIQAQEA